MKNLPDSVGPYKIVKKLGEGGFATVYLAHPKDRDSSQCVALKVLKSRENYGRFQREIQTAARLIHPNIVRIYDTGEDKDTRTPFFSMAYISGGSLRDRLEAEYRLPGPEAVEIIRHIGSALIYPHQQDIIHCDVNPKNILLDIRFNPARPVLTDFGLVKPLGMEGSELTETIALVGTFAFYAPEQWHKEDVGPETDVYALAITFFEMVSGRRPFEGDVFSLREKHLYQPFPRLSDFVPEIGSFFDDVLLKATAKEPQERFGNVAQFIEAIDIANEQAKQHERVIRQERVVEPPCEVTCKIGQNQLEARQILDTLKQDLEELAYSGIGAHNQEHELQVANPEDDDDRNSLLMLGGLFVTLGNNLIKEATEASNPDIAQLEHKFKLSRYQQLLHKLRPDHRVEPRPGKPEKRSLFRQLH